MGTSVQPPVPPAAPARADVMLEDIEKDLKAQEAQDKKNQEAAAAKEKADAEAAARRAAEASSADPKIKALEEALRISEEGRRRTEDTLRTAGLAAPKKVEEPELTEEQLAELFQKEPIKAIGYMQAKATKAVEENISRRLDPLISGGATGARELTRSKYPDEFQLFDKEISAMLDNPAISKSAMNQPKAWEDLIFYIRGQPGNMEKLIELKAGKEREKAADGARSAQAASAGTHTRSDVRPPVVSVGADLDDTEREIARTINSDLDPEEAYAEYKKWRGVAR